jgi:hypothetical protein
VFLLTRQRGEQTGPHRDEAMYTLRRALSVAVMASCICNHGRICEEHQDRLLDKE